MEVISLSGIAAPDPGERDPGEDQLPSRPRLLDDADDNDDDDRPRATLTARGFVLDPDGEWTICTSRHYDQRTGRLHDGSNGRTLIGCKWDHPSRVVAHRAV